MVRPETLVSGKGVDASCVTKRVNETPTFHAIDGTLIGGIAPSGDIIIGAEEGVPYTDSWNKDHVDKTVGMPW